MITVRIWFGLLLCLLYACSTAQEAPSERSATWQTKKVLIVYLSRTQNTAAVAAMIQKQIAGDLVALELETPYPTHYQTAVDQVAKENANGFLPVLKTKIDDIASYDVIFIGFPTWGMQLPPPIKSFLTTYNLAGKTVVPFNTNAGYGIGSSFETVSKLCRDCIILEGVTTKGGIERDGIMYVMDGDKELEVNSAVQKWLQNIGSRN